DSCPCSSRSLVILQIPLGLRYHAKCRPLEAQSRDLGGQQPQPAIGFRCSGARNVLPKICRDSLDGYWINLREVWQHLEYRAVRFAIARQRGLNSGRQGRARHCRFTHLVRHISVRENVERGRVDDRAALDQNRAFLPQRVTDTKLVKYVCVVMRDIADDQVRFDNKTKHVFADITGFDDLSRRASNEASTLQRGPDKFCMHTIEVYHASGRVLLDTERTDDKCALFVGWRHIQLGLPGV